MAFPPGLVDQCADEAGTDAAALMIGADFSDGVMPRPARALDQDTVAEDGSGADQGDQVGYIDRSP